jgi:prevent-host-death family protein
MREQTITATKFRRELGEVLDDVAKGITTHVVRNGRPLCTLVSTDVYEALFKTARTKN